MVWKPPNGGTTVEPPPPVMNSGEPVLPSRLLKKKLKSLGSGLQIGAFVFLLRLTVEIGLRYVSQIRLGFELLSANNDLDQDKLGEMIRLLKVKEKQREAAENSNGKPPVKKQSAGELRLHKDINELNLPRTCRMSFPNGKNDLMNFEVTIRPDEGYYKFLLRIDIYKKRW
ncbi:hypothetical protein AgCh_020166 [Apium graveolens]